jgi:hypothetical protein
MMGEQSGCFCMHHFDMTLWDQVHIQEEMLLYEDVMGLMPTFKTILSEFAEDPSELDKFIALVSNYMCARNEILLTL